MADRQDLSASYCPVCGLPVSKGEAVHAEEPLDIQGTFERQGAHLQIEGSEIRVYEHGEGGA